MRNPAPDRSRNRDGFRFGDIAAHPHWHLLDNFLYLPVVIPEITQGVSLLIFFYLIFDFVDRVTGGAIHPQLGFATIIIGHVAFNISYVAIVVRDHEDLPVGIKCDYRLATRQTSISRHIYQRRGRRAKFGLHCIDRRHSIGHCCFAADALRFGLEIGCQYSSQKLTHRASIPG